MSLIVNQLRHVVSRRVHCSGVCCLRVTKLARRFARQVTVRSQKQDSIRGIRDLLLHDITTRRMYSQFIDIHLFERSIDFIRVTQTKGRSDAQRPWVSPQMSPPLMPHPCSSYKCINQVDQ
jgi:hypothetical protein